MSQETSFKLEAAIIDELEDESYLKPDFTCSLKNEVKSKIEEFSNWFNSTARLYLLRCSPDESETFIYLLLNLKKKLKFAISEINQSVSNTRHSFTCNCGETVTTEPWQNVWSTLQEHPHFEETYSQACDPNYSNSETIENEDTSTTNDSVADDLSEDLNNLDLITLPQPEPEETKLSGTSLNDFKFNFVITYDQRVEEALYPDPLIVVARRRDNVSEYTIQRCGVGRAVCLLCPCSLISRGRVFKITPFIVKNHVSGQRHLKYASTPVNTFTLKKYHEFWRSQDPCFQAHQVYFIPDIVAINCLKCQLCQECVNYYTVVEHIKSRGHRSRVLKIFNSPEGKLNDFYLLDMQVEIYDVVSETKKEDKSKEVKEGSTSTNGSAPPKCVFKQFVINPNGLNLPPRYKEHLEFFTKNSELITCKICKMTFNNSLVAMKQHIYTPQHKQKSGCLFPKYNYFCEICNTYMKDEGGWDDHFIKGPNRHSGMSPSRKEKAAEYECKTCMVVIYGDDRSLSRHITARAGKNGRAKEIRLPFSVKKLFKSKSFIQDEAQRLQNEATLVLEYQEKMKECCDDLEEALKGMFQNCKAYPFGSRISGLGNNQSDLDVFMDIGEMYFGEKHQDSYSQEQFVKKVSKLLKSDKEDFSYVIPIPSARTPIVKLHHNYTNLDCDISFRHGLGVENTKFLKFCIDLQPVTQPFILLLKKWSEYCKLNEHITNYGLALMAIFFLQLDGYLLSVKTVRSYNPTQSLVIDGWDTLKYTVSIEQMKEFVKPYTAGIKQLLRDFFFYFSKFDYANQVVCPLLGSTVPKLLFNEKPNESLPIEMKTYIQRIQSENGEQFRGLTPFCIQDPFDLSHNLTKACQHGTINRLKALCTLTYEFLDSID